MKTYSMCNQTFTLFGTSVESISSIYTKILKYNSNYITHVKKGLVKVSDNFVHFLKRVRQTALQNSIKIQEREGVMRIMSYNVKWNDDNEANFENSWEFRKQHVASMIRFHHVDLVGLQEPMLEQMQDIEALLPEFSWFGVGVDDGKDNGSFDDAILYRKSRFKLLEQSHFFLSNTPEVPSIGWDAKYRRAVNWVKLYDKKNKKTFYFFNTHFDYHGQAARDESAYLLRGKITEITNGHAFVVTGDFNLFPDLGGKGTYQILTKKAVNEGDIKLYDAQHKTLFPHHGPTGTWSGFKEPGQPGVKPDFIFVSEDVTVVSHGILSDTFDGKYPSDHLPVVAEIHI
jgi:endonuclease/exonuclease/phosphatase family metal-dependent hydrolase